MKLKKRVIRAVLEHVTKKELIAFLREICVEKHGWPCATDISCGEYTLISNLGLATETLRNTLHIERPGTNKQSIYKIQGYIYKSQENLENIIKQIEEV